MLGAGVGAAGLGLDLWGTVEASASQQDAANFQAQAYKKSGDIARLDIQANAVKARQMAIMSNRQAVENARNVQKAQAIGVSTATNAGGQYGTELNTEEGAARAQGAYNFKGILQNYLLGTESFDISNQQSQDKIQIAGLESQAATKQGDAAKWQGIASIGAGLMGASSSIGNLAGK
jgi:hypothetical protein